MRRIAGRPSTTLYRLLTDPADGRCIERTLARYAPDAAMRAQLRAADVLSRAPGSTVPARSCDLDHVEEYLLGGTTSETNLQAVERPWHALKTEKFWDAAMDASRNVTWESFWGRLYRTRAHDYRQYLTRPLSLPEQAERRQHDGRRPDRQQSRPPGSGAGRPALSATAAAGAGLDPDRAEEQRHLASLLVYAALAHRAPADRLEAPDDDPDSDTEILGLREAIWLRRTTASGRRTTGPRPDLPAPEHLVTHDPRALLDHPDWTSLGRPRPEPGPGHLPAAGPGTKPGDDSTGDGAAAPPPF